jgi:hypothetical protein
MSDMSLDSEFSSRLGALADSTRSPVAAPALNDPDCDA